MLALTIWALAVLPSAVALAWFHGATWIRRRRIRRAARKTAVELRSLGANHLADWADALSRDPP